MLVTVDRYGEMTCRTEYAVRSYINNGVCTEGAEFVRDPKGRIMIDTEGADAQMRMIEALTK